MVVSAVGTSLDCGREDIKPAENLSGSSLMWLVLADNSTREGSDFRS